MVMDKGLSLREAENMCDSSADFVDLLKFGFGTSLITKKLKEKINVYKKAGIKPYFGGSLFELFYARDMFDEFRRFVDNYEIEIIEVSDGVVEIPHNEKCEFIHILSKDYTVLSEVGYKVTGKELTNEQWIEYMQTELDAGSWKVIAEAREGGNMGIYDKAGMADCHLVQEINDAIKDNKIIWEAPLKNQQTWFIKLLGSQVNLGNIAPNEALPLETLRLGLRGDTLLDHLPEKKSKIKA